MKTGRLKVIFKTIPLAFSVSKKLFIFDVFLSIVSGFFGVVIIYTSTHLFDTVGLIHNSGNEMILHDIVVAILVYFVVLIVKELIDWVSDYLGFIVSEKSIIALSEMLHEKANKIDPVSFENSKLLDYIENAGRGIYFIDYCSKNIINLFLRDIPYLFFVGFYLYSLKPILFWIPILIFVPVVISELLRTKMFVQLKDEKAPIERKLSKYASYMVDTDFFKETRTLGCFSYFKKLYIDTLKILNTKTWKMERRSQTIEIISKLITLAGYYGVLFLLFITLMEGTISVGAFAAVFASLQMLYSTANHIIVDRIGSILTGEFAEINSMVNYLTIPNRIYGNDETSLGTIQLEKVSFSYPGREKAAISDVDLSIEQGDIIAIVGENGSGKTTLAKIILGIYTHTVGSVFVDGKPYSKLSRKALFDKKSAVFQNYYKYLFNLQDNISISDMRFEPDRENLDIASRKAGVNVTDRDVFPGGYQTLLSKRFGGVELSGGEWQRVAIARGFYRESNVIVLDEPTAAIDPIEEGNVYRKFIEISKGKTAIIITHRLGSTKIANKIVVMQQGKIIQTGNHNTLMQQDGVYKTMYESQSMWYKD